MKTFNRFAVLAILVLTTALCSVSCTDDDKDGEGPVLPQATPRVIVVNEGGMGSGLAGLSVLYTDGNIVYDPFRKANNRPLGDVAQFMDCFNGKYFVTLNSSNKVEVIDTASFESVATIVFDEDCSPRYMAAVSDSTAVVSDANRLLLINTKTNKFIEYIETENKYEQMLTVGNKLFCANKSAKNIAVYNTNDLNNPRFIDLNNYPCKTSPLIEDRNGNIWVYCAIEFNPSAPKFFVKFNPETEQVLETISLPDSIKTRDYLRMDRDSKGDKIYFDGYVPGGFGAPDAKFAYTIDVDTHEFAKYVALRGTDMIYGMNVDADGGVWVCDCLDYSRQRGYLRYYPADNSDVLTSWRVGIYPNLVYFPDKNK